MTQWYYAIKGDRQGPLDLAGIESLIKGGTLSATDLVWNQEMGSTWAEAGDVPALSGVLAEGPEVPPPPPVEPGKAEETAQLKIKKDEEPQQAKHESSVEKSPMMAHFAKGDPASAEAGEVADVVDFSHSNKKGVIRKIVLFALLAVGVYLGYRKFFYKSPALLAYSEFAQALFEYRYEDAVEHVEEGPLQDYYRSGIGRKLRRPDGTYVRMEDPVATAPPEIHSKKYVLISAEYGAGKESVSLEVEQRVGVLISISPYHIIVVRHHKAKLVKTDDGWKVSEQPELEKKGYFSPSSATKVWDEPLAH